jgi:hypothetical protein
MNDCINIFSFLETRIKPVWQHACSPAHLGTSANDQTLALVAKHLQARSGCTLLIKPIYTVSTFAPNAAGPENLVA